MSNSLLVEYYQQIPEARSVTKPKVTRKEAIEVFKHRIAERYSEGTLLRLLENGDNLCCRAALLALGLLGTMNSCASIAARLHDEDHETAQLAADTLWTLWFRGDTPANNQELQRLARLRDRDKALANMNALIQRAPRIRRGVQSARHPLFSSEKIRSLDRGLREDPGAESLSLRRSGGAGAVLHADAKASGGAQGIPRRPASQSAHGRRRGNDPRARKRARRGRPARR